MSVENHPNINAAGFVTDIIIAFRKHLRGEAEKNMPEAVQLLVDSGLADFVNKVGANLDVQFCKCRESAIGP